ncbi:MAG: hypothetical protein U9N73_08160 [Candidatus Auribacterota bacterium]|nr:hypothetical protein [Candidatus Auribacterota bacterium]
MQTKLAQLKRYIHETIGVVINPNPWDGSTRLPFFFREHYTYFEIQLLNKPYLIMLDSNLPEPSPATIRKHMDQVKEKWCGEIVYVRERVTAYNRKRLIEHKLPFVVPGNQMYLPLLGIDLREHFKTIRSKTSKFSPSTQALFIYILLCGTAEKMVTPAGMAQCLGYSAMTMTRAFNQIEAAGLGDILSKGRERCLRFVESAKEVWEKAQPFLRSPVKKRLFISQTNLELLGPRAGLAALTQYSMLAEPANPNFALSSEDWKSLKQRRRVKTIPNREPEAFEIEIWSYAPTLFAKDMLVDRLSLYLSLRESKDERIEAALEEMLKELPW